MRKVLLAAGMAFLMMVSTLMMVGPATAHVGTGAISGTITKDTCGFSCTIYGNAKYVGHTHPHARIDVVIQQASHTPQGDFVNLSSSARTLDLAPAPATMQQPTQITCDSDYTALDSTYRLRIRFRTWNNVGTKTEDVTRFVAQHRYVSLQCI